MKEALKKLPFEDGKFEANGKIYYIENGFSIERYSVYQQLELEAGFSVKFEDVYRNWNKVLELANKQQFADIVLLADNMRRGVAALEYKEPVFLKMCALFCNTEHEDRSSVNEDLITEKINDWKLAGYEIEGFFTLALNTIKGFIDAYKKLTQLTSEAQEAVDAAESQVLRK